MRGIIGKKLGMTQLFDEESGSVTPVRIVVASYDADSAYVASGLPEGAEIVALGVHKFDAKQKVRVVENLAGLRCPGSISRIGRFVIRN